MKCYIESHDVEYTIDNEPMIGWRLWVNVLGVVLIVVAITWYVS